MDNLTVQPESSIPLKVLLVDGSMANIGQWHTLLDSRFEVFFETDGPAAVATAKVLQPDIVVMGIENSTFDSSVVCYQMQAPVVLLTEAMQLADMVKSFGCGAVDYLQMPCDQLIFNLRLEAHVLIHRAQISNMGATISSDPQVMLNAKVGGHGDSGAELQKVLIVDDSISNIQVLNEILGDDYEVFFATSGQQAIVMALEERPDLILLDVVMPQMNGYQVCQQLKAMPETRDIGIVFVTALHEQQDEEKGLKMGAIDYIVKPFCAHIVRARMHNHMELVKHRKMLSSLSMTDGLTGIANRRQFDQVIHRELYRAIRNKESLTVILIDIDNFKKYNDYYGHVSGDECLRQVAQALDCCRVRMTDFVARYGGEEFAVILPNTNHAGAIVMVDKILDGIATLAIEHLNNNNLGRISASMGVYCQIPESEQTIEAIVHAADEALYQAKTQGRNRAVFNQG